MLHHSSFVFARKGVKMPLESDFKKKLINQIMQEYPGAIVLKNDASFINGIPDHLVLFRNRWAAFEAKRDIDSPHRPNQPYWVKKMDEMSLAAFVYPQNKEWFLNELQHTLRPKRSARLP
jgi:hypothetical protein